jgi:Cytochrome P450
LPSIILSSYLYFLPFPCRTGEDIVDPTSGITIPKDTDVQVLLHTLHTHPQHWGKDALLFNPDRWLDASGPASKAVEEGIFYPFLDGLRRCAGMYAAETEFILLAYTLLVLFDTKVAFPTSSATTTPSSSELGWNANKPWLSHSCIAPAFASFDASEAAAIEANNAGAKGSSTHTEGYYRLRLRADMFSSFDGVVPFTITPRW